VGRPSESRSELLGRRLRRGFQYEFDLVPQAEAQDLVLERDGARAVVDQMSMLLLKGSEIDFVDELAGAQFRVRNPNAKSSCGCGVSFSV
jgi:iron-sulfur cluster assembly accessory protein